MYKHPMTITLRSADGGDVGCVVSRSGRSDREHVVNLMFFDGKQ